MKESKYTLRGDAAFDEMLDKCLASVAEAVEDSGVSDSIAAIVLGGGYGRGEGGVFAGGGREKRPYNDLDFFVIAENVGFLKRKKIDRGMAGLGKALSAELGVEVDFGPAKTLKQLSRVSPTMLWQELKEGHLVIYGDRDVLQALPYYDLRDLPRVEGLQLLLNRGAGLLLAKQLLEKGDNSRDELDFIGRNLYKAVLACGDVFLLIQKQYCFPILERLARLEDSKGKKIDPQDVDLYEKAVEFKLSPRICTMSELIELQALAMNLYEKTCRYFFSVCYGLTINNLQELNRAFEEEDPFSKDFSCREKVKNTLLNLACMRRFGWRYMLSGRNPRLGLLRVLLGLLFEHYRSDEYIKLNENKFLICWNKLN
jgi:hypothetical protein